MQVSRKTRYALLAVLELARRHGGRPVPTHVIADAQAIPSKFLEAILNELARAGVLTVRRGSLGGYQLRVDPSRLAVGAVVEAVEGPIDVIGCKGPTAQERASLGERALMGMWGRVDQAVSDVLDATTFRDVLEEEKQIAELETSPSYAI